MDEYDQSILYKSIELPKNFLSRGKRKGNFNFEWHLSEITKVVKTLRFQRRRQRKVRYLSFARSWFLL